jgi:hypothetical protein
MNKLYLIMVQESAEEVTSRESKPTLEEGRKHLNFIRVGCGDIFFGIGAPLQHGSIGEKVVHRKIVNFLFISDGWLEKVRMRSCH